MKLLDRKLDVSESDLEFANRFSETRAFLYRKALSLTGNAFDADDLVQETGLRAMKFFDRFESGTNFQAWVSRMMWNLFVNSYRVKKSRPQSLNLAELKPLEQKGKRYSESFVERSKAALEQIDDKLRAALMRLPRKQRLIVFLRAIEGCSYEEIATITELPIGTVMSSLHRARDFVREAIGQEVTSVRYPTRKNMLG